MYEPCLRGGQSRLFPLSHACTFTLIELQQRDSASDKYILQHFRALSEVKVRQEVRDRFDRKAELWKHRFIWGGGYSPPLSMQSFNNNILLYSKISNSEHCIVTSMSSTITVAVLRRARWAFFKNFEQRQRDRKKGLVPTSAVPCSRVLQLRGSI